MDEQHIDKSAAPTVATIQDALLAAGQAVAVAGAHTQSIDASTVEQYLVESLMG